MVKETLVAPEGMQVNDPKISEAFEILGNIAKPVMSEQKFREKYLPFLKLEPIPQEHIDFLLEKMRAVTGRVKHTEKDLIGNLTNEWLTDVGSMYADVDIVDEKGEVIFTVPAFFDRAQTPIKDAGSFARNAEHAALQAEVMPTEATRFINKTMLPLVNGTITNVEYAEKWNKIYRYYDLPLFKINGSSESKSTTLADNVVDGFDYDD